MKKLIDSVYHFLPVQLLLLHLRKSQLLLIFWVVIFLTVTHNFATAFGAATLFLAPEYLGQINFTSMALLGMAMGIYVMSWNITTFIMHKSRIPFLGATRQSFLKYCYNNTLLPLLFLTVYTFCTVRYQLIEEHFSMGKIMLMQLGFYLGYFITVAFSFAYFFRVDRNVLKTVMATITNPSVVRELIPYDTLDAEYSRVLPARTFLNRPFTITDIKTLEAIPTRTLEVILRRHHRNAIFATLVTLLVLIILGLFADEPLLRIPAAAGFLILFAVLVGILGAVKYFLRTWEMIGWVMIITLASFMVSMRWIDMRSTAYGINYNSGKKPMALDYETIRSVMNPTLFAEHKASAQQWMEKRVATMSTSDSALPPLVIISVSGGGSRAAYFTFRALQYADSMSGGQLYKHTLFMTGASGGMLGATYWRALHHKQPKDIYNPKYQENMGKDLLNAIVFSMATVDAISPFNKINIGPYRYKKNRGYAMEEELINNTQGLLGGTLGDVLEDEQNGIIPSMLFCGTILNDSRKLIISPQPVSYLCQPQNTLNAIEPPPIDAIDFQTYFKDNDPMKLRLVTALRMSATFPIVLPVVKMPTLPEMNIMDAGMRDNFGVDLAIRFINVHKEWLKTHGRKVILLQIRDTRAHQIFPTGNENSLERMIFEPMTVMTEKWEPFQSFAQDHLKDIATTAFGDMLQIVPIELIPNKEERHVALNFHLTSREKNELLQSIYQRETQEQMKQLQMLLQ